jgi:hypothetical protein
MMADKEFKEKLRSLSFSKGNRGGTKTTIIQRDDNGKIAGKQTEHWDDHVDAVAHAPALRVKAKMVGEEVQ